MLLSMFSYLPLSGVRDMTARIRQEQRSRQLVVVKRATEPAQRSALQREAHALGSLRHPGVIDVIEYTTGVGPDELTTDHAGSVSASPISIQPTWGRSPESWRESLASLPTSTRRGTAINA